MHPNLVGGIDVALLVDFFLNKFAVQHGMDAKQMDPVALSLLESHDWPGNVRELRNVIESMFLTTEDSVLGVTDLPPEIGLSIVTDKHDGTESLVAIGNLEDAEMQLICVALEADHGNLTMVARHLGIAKSTLYAKLKKYQLNQVVVGVRGLVH